MAQPYRCPVCRTRRKSFMALVQHCIDHGHRVCTCGGYDYPHRLGSPCCDAHPMAPVYRAMRAKEDFDLEEIEMDCVWYGTGREMKVWKE